MTGPNGPSRVTSPVVVFDGVCGLCTRSVRFIVRRERAPKLNFVSLQSVVGRALASAHGIDPNRLDSVILVADGVAWERSDAALRIARYLRLPWRIAASLVVVPRSFRDLAYDWIARNRYAWFGRLDSEWVPPKEIEARFLQRD